MRTQSFRLFAALSFVMVLALAPLSAADTKLKAQIPFEFMAGGKTLPAGEYTVSELGPTVLCVRGEEKNSAVMFTANSVQAPSAPKEGKLVFNKYGEQYFLSRIWTPVSNIGRELPKSKAERDAVKGDYRREMAFVIAVPQR